MITAPGIYPDMTAAEYFADPCPSPSLTQSISKKLLNKSPRHAWLMSPLLNPDWKPGDSDGYDADRAIGNAAHAYMLGRGKQVEVMVVTNFRTSEARIVRDHALDAGRVPILPHHNDRASEMVAAAQPQLTDRGYGALFSPKIGKSEVVIACQIDGIWLRSMIDWITDDHMIIADYKTGGMNCAPHAVVNKMKSDTDDVSIQAAMHELILDNIDPENAGRRKHIFVFQENYHPYALNAVSLTEEWMTMGRKQIANALGQWRSCMLTKRWPLYPIDSGCPPYPSYQMSKILGREIEEDERRKQPSDLIMAG